MKTPNIRATLFALALVAAAVTVQAATYAIDASHSSVSFKVRHMMLSKVTGTFESFSGTVVYDEGNLADWSVEATVEMASVNTNDAKRDEHLRSADFFDVETYPEMSFASTGVKKDGDDYVLTGDLTLMGVTRPVSFELEFNGMVEDPWGNIRVGFSAEGKIDRRDYGITWNKAMDKGGVVVGEDVDISLEIEAVKQ